MATEKKVKAELEKLRAAIAEASEEDEPEEEEGDDEGEEPEALQADVAKKAKGVKVKGSEIEGVSEATMQAFLEETRQVKALLKDGKISSSKAQSILSPLFELFGLDA